ncbi:Uncharacterized protein BM_BM18081 [Brugia malayi]|uniref:Uncharacterized protein n=1 Tax=Brugia malayi TaxID=6279 RepID=A0A4E9EZK4_BRUMA|nr:Uncharacterized protein BM_BM18081 [Brugia malayi]VIO89903.1 Uncharacterized protein BM_BM18081 [Brugia malayi]
MLSLLSETKWSSPGGTPGPYGRIRQKQDFIDIKKEIEKLKRISRKLNKTEINKKSMEGMELKSSSKLFEYNLNKQTQNEMHFNALFEQKSDENNVNCANVTNVNQNFNLNQN